MLGVLILAVLLFPLYWMINASLEPAADLLRIPPQWFPAHPTLEGYRSALSTEGRHLISSLIVAGGTVLVALVVGAPAAWALASFRLRGGRWLLLALLVVQMVPGIVMANAMYGVMNRLHLINTYVGLILADSTLAVPFAVLILRAFMVTIPRELPEAAQVDGASRLRTFVSVVVPLSRNAFITAGLFSFLFAWADFLFAVTITTGGDISPVTVSIYRFVGAHVSDWNGVMATGVIASIPAAVLLVIAQRYVAAGLTGGALKD